MDVPSNVLNVLGLSEIETRSLLFELPILNEYSNSPNTRFFAASVLDNKVMDEFATGEIRLIPIDPTEFESEIETRLMMPDPEPVFDPNGVSDGGSEMRRMIPELLTGVSDGGSEMRRMIPELLTGVSDGGSEMRRMIPELLTGVSDGGIEMRRIIPLLMLLFESSESNRGADIRRMTPELPLDPIFAANNGLFIILV
jgi:hypothetical protein